VIICAAIISDNYIHSNSVSLSFAGEGTLVISKNNENYVVGYKNSNDYKLKNIVDNKNIAYLSAGNLDKNDISSLTHFIINNKVNTVTVPADYSSALLTINNQSICEKCFVSDNFYLSHNGIKITEYTKDKAHAVVFNIKGFKIIYLEIDSYTELDKRISCDLLILNTKALTLLDSFDSKYLIISDGVFNSEHIKNLTNNRKITFLGDYNCAPMLLKDGNLKIKSQILTLS